MLNRKLLFRVDVGRQIGTGHAMRCLALAQEALARGWSCYFLLTEELENISERLQTEGFGFSILGIDRESGDARGTLLEAHRIGADWVILDGYLFAGCYQERIKDAGLRLLVIDDRNQPWEYSADLILNQNPYARASTYREKTRGARLLLGSSYALLRREFRQIQRSRDRLGHDASRLLVTVGGTDPRGLGALVAKALAEMPRKLEVVFVAGSAHAAENIRKIVKDVPHIRVEENVTDMPRLMAWADMALSAAGTTTWELLYMGVATMLVAVADNQVPVSSSLDAMQMTRNLGPINQLTSDRIVREVTALVDDHEQYLSFSRRGIALIDGKGAERTLRAMAAASPSFRLREATMEDARRIWEWRNDPESRAGSFCEQPITWAEHQAWFATKLASANCRFFMAVDSADRAFGQVRFDMQRAQAEISITLDPSYRGKGLGSDLIHQAVEELLQTQPSCELVHASIKANNKGSIRAFERAGFIEDACSGGASDALHFIRTKLPGSRP